MGVAQSVKTDDNHNKRIAVLFATNAISNVVIIKL